MKKIILTLALAAMAATSAFAQLSVGAGYVNSTLTNKVSDNKSTDTALNGAYVNANFTLPIAGGLKLVPGVVFSYIGGESSSNLGSIIKGTVTRSEMNLSIPVNVTYGVDLGKSLSAFVFAGPTVDLGCLASLKGEVESILGSGSKDADLYGENSNYGRFDVLVGGGAGVDIAKIIRLTVGYNYGVLDRNSADNATAHRGFLHAGVSYLF